MDLSEEHLENEDYFFIGFDRFRFIACRSCSLFSPFLFHLPPNEKLNRLLSTWNGELLFCAECLPKSEELRKFYTSSRKGEFFNIHLIELLKGYKYSNPYYKMFALIERVLITTDSIIENIPSEIDKLVGTTDVARIHGLFPDVHYVPNKKYSGLEEINQIICAKMSEIRQFYNTNLNPPMIAERSNSSAIEIEIEKFIYDSEQRDDTVCNETVVYTEGLIVGEDRRFKLTVLSADTDYACDICLLTEKNALKYGDFIEKRQTKTLLRCHYFCLLSGTLIVQQGRDKSGILGFLVKDIMDSFPKYRDKICSYCNGLSASIKCAESKCQRWFHYICGYKNGCLTQFIGEHLSFCHEHQPIFAEKPHGSETQCWICWDFMPPYKPVSNFFSICPPEEPDKDPTVEYTWYHRKCIQRAAFESGYYFKCPNCYERKEFVEHAQSHGIFVPMRDATWELEKDAYKDIHKNKCTAKKCTVPRVSTKRLQLVGCKVCGGGTVHVECAGVKIMDEYICSHCMDATFIKLF
ncbi:PHD finger protein 7-like [Wyeomyia smithii]|uniref:PHD finger protein 7-like n=1 Tax=Wyeomyia smithii TaxID=174621 RepID=UPI002468208E|nr:PHD finger protein 7-like [Wyeomyia smithii]